MLSRKIAESTVRRLSIYLRFLEEFDHEGAATVSSRALADRAGTTSSQVRKDLSFFGSFGKRGLGYNVVALSASLRTILGLEKRYRVIMVGAGRLAGALIEYAGFGARGFDIVAVVDRDPAKIGQSWGPLLIQDVEAMEKISLREKVGIAILATPAEAAQGVAERLAAAGVSAILNFAPVQLQLPDDVDVKNVNLAIELETLSYALQRRGPRSESTA